MTDATRHVVVLGGGSAGWLVAGLLAAEHRTAAPDGLRITLIESPDVASIGVGEGTWPTMRDTLRRIGVSESDFIRECDASFKQGSKFVRWAEDREGDRYYHPFVLPQGYLDTNLVAGWLAQRGARFAELVSFQPHLCEAGCAPKQFQTPEFAAVANYAYHLDAVKLGQFLRRHAIGQLGVRHVADHVESVRSHENGDIAAVVTRTQGAIEADLFVDCTGMRSLLIGQHFGIELTRCADVLFNDRALAVQVPYADARAPIACQTISTAQSAGWIWDIGLPTRRGVGYVYSSAHTTDEAAVDTVQRYIESSGGRMRDATAPRRIDIDPGYRRVAWQRNCVAIGLSSGFVEPLEASSLVLVELAATMLSDQMPANRAAMDLVAARFNASFAYRWERVIDFLKLHYVLSRREDSDYWRDHRRNETVPAHLQSLLALWRHQPPSRYDLPRVDEIFPSASYQYVLYGMGFRPEPRATTLRADDVQRAQAHFREVADLTRRMLDGLPSHREMLEHAATRGMPLI
jgi:tryptophan halogenase